MTSNRQFCLLCIVLFATLAPANCCRVESEKLKSYTRESIEYLLDANQLESVYWPEAEPLDERPLAKALGINVTLAETHFRLEPSESSLSPNQLEKRSAAKEQLIRDVFVTCSIDRGRSYALSINLELTNPFKVIEVQFNTPREAPSSSSNEEVTKTTSNKAQRGSFLIRLPQSSFLVNLRQRVRYDECLTINYVQLAPQSGHEIECIDCTAEQQSYLDKALSKRMTQLETQLDSILSEKLLLGLEVLLNQQRLELDLLLENTR